MFERVIGIDVREAVGSSRTGKGEYAYQLIRALFGRAELASRVVGWRFVMYSDVEFDVEDVFGAVPEGVQVDVRVVRAPSLLWHVVVAWRARFMEGVDRFFAPTSYLVPWMIPSRSVVVVHDVYVLTDLAKGHDMRASVVEKFALGRVVQQAAQVVTVSEFTRDELVARVGGRSVDDISVVEFALGDEGGVEGAAARLPDGVGDEFLLFVGTIEPRKNVVLLIEAFAEFVLREGVGADVQLVLAGKLGWGVDEAREAVERLELGDRVVMTGFISEEEKRGLYEVARVFVYPSKYEGFGIPLLEAMRAGVAVVASDAGALREVGGDAVRVAGVCEVEGDVGRERLVQAIFDVYTDSDLRNELIAAGKARVGAYSWEKSAATLIDLLG